MRTLVNTKREDVIINDKQVVVRCNSTIDMEKLPISKEEIYKSINMYFPNVNFDGNMISFDTEGKSKCSPEDKFDKTTGIHIAESRAQQKAYSIAARLYFCFSIVLIEKMNTLRVLSQNAYNCEMHCFNHQYLLGNN